MSGKAPNLPLLHRLWRRLPARGRRRMLTALTGAVAPRLDRVPPVSATGVAVVGEFSRASGLGEGARLMSRSLGQLGIPHWDIDVGPMLPAHTADFAFASEAPPPGALLVLHVNPPLLPLVLLGLPRGLVRGRRVVGYWSWELPAVPPEWRAGTRFVHEVWVPSDFAAAAVEPLLPGHVRVVPHPVTVVPPVPSALDRAAFGLPPEALVVLVSFNLASSFERKNPLAAIAAFRAAFGDRADRILLLKIGNPAHFPTDFARIGAAVIPAPRQTCTSAALRLSRALSRAMRTACGSISLASTRRRRVLAAAMASTPLPVPISRMRGNDFLRPKARGRRAAASRLGVTFRGRER